MSWYLNTLKKYTVFDGRARRKEFWMFALFNFIITFIIAFIESFLDTQIISIIYTLAILLPSIAVSVRRLHDIGKSGYWYFIGFIPIIGSIWILVLMCKDSQTGENIYGPNPKEI